MTASEVPLFERFAEMAVPAGGAVVILAEAYVDESGTHDGSPMLTVAGYLFRQVQARRFSREWQKALGEMELPAAHQTDCAIGLGDYEGWSKQERVECQKRLIQCIKCRTAFGFGVSVDPKMYNDIVGTANNAPCAYTFALQGCMTIIRRWAKREAFDGLITYIFEAGHRSQGEANRYIAMLVDSERAKQNAHYSGHAFLDKRVALPLQAADMLAWQYHHHHARKRAGIDHVRADFRALVRPKDVCIDHDEESLKRFRRDIIDEGWLVDRY